MMKKPFDDDKNTIKLPKGVKQFAMIVGVVIVITVCVISMVVLDDIANSINSMGTRTNGGYKTNSNVNIITDKYGNDINNDNN